MKVTKQMLHPDLRPYFMFWRVLDLIPFCWATRLQNFVLKHFFEGKNIEGLAYSRNNPHFYCIARSIDKGNSTGNVSYRPRVRLFQGAVVMDWTA